MHCRANPVRRHQPVGASACKLFVQGSPRSQAPACRGICRLSSCRRTWVCSLCISCVSFHLFNWFVVLGAGLFLRFVGLGAGLCFTFYSWFVVLGAGPCGSLSLAPDYNFLFLASFTFYPFSSLFPFCHAPPHLPPYKALLGLTRPLRAL